MVKGVINPDLSVGLHRESTGVDEVGITDIILTAGGAGLAEFPRPPVVCWIRHKQARLTHRRARYLALLCAATLALGLKASATQQPRLIGEDPGSL